ncbi:MAG: hypothetical protein NC081_02575 [Roseburia sp.]|nr:hypothetical protein [Roseburia sp.]
MEYSKNSVKYMDAVNKPTKKRLKEAIEKYLLEMLKNLIELVPEPEELEALRAGREDRIVNGTISHEAINWD